MRLQYILEQIKMHKITRDFILYSLILIAAMDGAACGLVNARTDNSNDRRNDSPPVIENETNGEKTIPQANRQTKSAPPVTSAAVAGTYTLNTLKNGYGNDNSLEIKNKGNGKIELNFSGTYIYNNSGNESAHEIEAGGDAKLKGNVAAGNLYQNQDDDDKCLATVTFDANQAQVKLSSGCNFNVSLEGVYKKSNAVKKAAVETSDLREVAYDKLDDFTNDIKNHRPGERYLIVNIPAYKIDKTSRADEFGNSSYKGLYYLQLNDEDTAVGSAFLTSAAMVKSLNANVDEYEPASLRATAVLVESDGEFDFYRLSFITKIEGLNDDGSFKWTATGAEPARIKYTH